MPAAIIPIVSKRETLVNWQATNPILLWGEVGMVHGNVGNSKPRFVVGDGNSTFNQLYDNSRFFLTYEDLNQNYLNAIVISLNELVSAEAVLRGNGDSGLQSQVTTLGNNLDSLGNDLDATNVALSAEIDNRINGDEGLQVQIDTINGQLQLMNGAVIYVGGVSGESIVRGDLLVINADGLLYKYDYASVSHRNAVFGLAMSDVGDSEELSVHLFGVFTATDPIFQEGARLYASQSTAGRTTGILPTGTNAIKVGYGITDYIINVSIEMAGIEAHNHSATEITSGTLAVARLGSNTPDSSLVLHGDNTWRSKVELTDWWEYFNDMVTNTAAQTVETITSSVATVGLFGTTSTAFGIAQMQTNAGATAHTCFRLTNTNLIVNRSTNSIYKARVLIDNLSTVTETFTLRCGFNDGANASSVGANSAMFRYTNAVNGGKWQCANRAANVETVADSGITVAVNTWYILEIRMTTTSILYYIDGALVQTIATNVLTSGVGQVTGIAKSVGTTSRNFRIDYYYLKIPTGR